jgi:hypothetical protein
LTTVADPLAVIVTRTAGSTEDQAIGGRHRAVPLCRAVLGKSLLREIDKGLANSRIGIVLVTPALLKSLEAEGIADKELSALLATDRGHPRRP